LLEQELGEIRDRENKHHLQKSHLELQLEKAKAEIGELKSDLASTQEKLDSTQSSLELLERKYSSARRKYGASKEKLGAYKTRLENERSIVKKLQDTLTPAAYKSLGATHETLGEFLSAMGLPSLGGGTSSLKEESD
jgi:chromosome segregation ATPase